MYIDRGGAIYLPGRCLGGVGVAIALFASRITLSQVIIVLLGVIIVFVAIIIIISSISPSLSASSCKNGISKRLRSGSLRAGLNRSK